MEETVTCYDFDGNPHKVEKSKIKPRTSCYGIYLLNSQILLTNDAGTKNWDLPGGGMEKGENKEETLKREFKEETGLTVIGYNYYQSIKELFYSYEGEAWDSEKNYYVIKSVIGNLQNQINRFGTAEAKFIEINQLNTVKVKESIKHLILQVSGELLVSS